MKEMKMSKYTLLLIRKLVNRVLMPFKVRILILTNAFPVCLLVVVFSHIGYINNRSALS